MQTIKIKPVKKSPLKHFTEIFLLDFEYLSTIFSPKLYIQHGFTKMIEIISNKNSVSTLLKSFKSGGYHRSAQLHSIQVMAIKKEKCKENPIYNTSIIYKSYQQLSKLV